MATAPQAPATHAGAMQESLGVGQTVHEAPQLFGSVALVQASWHRLNPELHATPQLVPSQVALPFGSVGHAVQDVVPQLFTFVFATHAPPHRW
jgi:hypothetical protein